MLHMYKYCNLYTCVTHVCVYVCVCVCVYDAHFLGFIPVKVDYSLDVCYLICMHGSQ